MKKYLILTSYFFKMIEDLRDDIDGNSKCQQISVHVLNRRTGFTGVL